MDDYFDICEEEEACERLIELFRKNLGRDPLGDSEAFLWADFDDATLVWLGFRDRARFNYWRDGVLALERALIESALGTGGKLN